MPLDKIRGLFVEKKCAVPFGGNFSFCIQMKSALVLRTRHAMLVPRAPHPSLNTNRGKPWARELSDATPPPLGALWSRICCCLKGGRMYGHES